MSDHSSSVFNNNCLKLPRNPRNTHPLPVYEQKYLNQLQNEATKLNLEVSNETTMKSASSKEKDPVKSYLEFYDSIPEYDELNHLSNKEFYKRIEVLKEKQKTYADYVQNESKYTDKTPEWLEEYKDYAKKKFVDEKKKKSKPFCVTPILSKSPKDVESLSGDLSLKPPSRRSVRIETPSEKLSPGDTPSELFRRPKSRLPSASSKGQDDWENFSIDDYKLDLEGPSSVQSKSAPSSPTRSKPSVGWKDDGITIPKPFEMTVRDEENKIIDEVIAHTKPKDQKPEVFKAHTVPIESQIPLFDKIMADQERKNHIVRERSKALLQAQMRPFSFTRRDEEIQEIQKLSKGLSKSSPSLFLDDPPIKIKKFKAKPIPKNLFSNYIYKKMHEDEFYRALQKKIRAEEMLRAASLPPSMAKRERTTEKYDVCPRSYRDVAESKSKKNKYRFAPNNYEKELEELKNEFLGISPQPKSKNKRSEKKQKKKAYRNPSAASTDSRTPSSLDLQSLNRSNLAAVLRVQSARKKLEMEMCRKLEEAKLKEEARWREKLMRKKPVWQALAFSHEEDLAMRLQLRRDEEKLRSEEHKLRMQLMLGRVNQQPTLFERQSQVKYPKTKDELLDKLYTEYKSRRDQKRSVSDLSDIRSLPELKDAAIQALLEEELKQETDSLNSKESIREEKEKDESLSSEDTN